MAKKRKSSRAVEVAMPARKSVDIKKANNGFVVSSYTERGEKVFIAKTKKEAKSFADKLLGFGK